MIYDIKPITYNISDFIYKLNEPIKNIYFVKKGEVEIQYYQEYEHQNQYNEILLEMEDYKNKK